MTRDITPYAAQSITYAQNVKLVLTHNEKKKNTPRLKKKISKVKQSIGTRIKITTY